jgi:NTP pyrophosphatase (non-canonical NTP hydrolase)
MMAAKGLAKLIEECGELQQVAGKKLAFYSTDKHPDGGPPLSTRMEDEMADVMAAIVLVTHLHKLDPARMHSRCMEKVAVFMAWVDDTTNDNNKYAVDAK